jgi:hypothetical protein
MIKFFLHEFILVRKLLIEQIELFKKCDSGDRKVFIAAKQIGELLALVGRLKRECDKLELSKSSDRVWRLEHRLDDNAKRLPHCEEMATELEQIFNTMDCELGERTLAYIPQKKSGFFESKALFGDQVKSAFPSLGDNIRNAGNCLATEINAATM